jgi:antirestriction protein
MTNTPTTTHPTITDQPAAWIGCLSCYNNGQLRGRWITAQEAADEITADQITYGNQAETVTTGDYTTQRCRKCGGDEFDVFDTQHTPASCHNVREFYENAEQLAELHDTDDLTRLITLADWLGNTTSLEDLKTYDDENYADQWDTFQDYAENYADETGLLDSMPDELRHYFDYEAFARDLAHDYYHDDTTGHTWRSC